MSIEPGIFTKIFAREKLGDALAAIRAHGLRVTQFNLACVGLPSLPEEIPLAVQEAIRADFRQHGVRMAAVSGTFNLIHPDVKQRALGLRRLSGLIDACPDLGTGVVTLCSGTRDPENMWRWHPDTARPEAWDDLVSALETILPLAESRGVVLAVEPEPANVIDRPLKARRLLDEMRSPALKVVMDAANLFHPGDLARIPAVLHDAFERLGEDIVLAHAKDLAAAGEVVAAGKGVLDYPLYLELLEQSGYSGPLILHSLSEDEVAGSAAFLRSFLG